MHNVRNFYIIVLEFELFTMILTIKLSTLRENPIFPKHFDILYVNIILLLLNINILATILEALILSCLNAAEVNNFGKRLFWNHLENALYFKN